MAFNKKKLQKLLENTADLSLKRKAGRIIEEINPQSKDKILEVGSGDAYYPSILARLGKFYIVGIELDNRVIDTAERNFKALGISYKRFKKWKNQKSKGVYFVEGDANKMPFKKNFFDKIIMSEVAEHLPNDLKGLKEVHRVLKPGGILVLTVPNWYFPFLWDPVNWVLQRPPFRSPIKKGFWAGIWNQHQRLYKPDEILSVLKKAGFEIDKVEVQTAWCLPFNHYIINLGARALAGGILPKDLHSQMNKFEESGKSKRSILIETYYSLARFFDSFNKKSYAKIGTTVFVKAKK